MGSCASQDSKKPYERPESIVTDLELKKDDTTLKEVQMNGHAHQSKREEIYLLKRMFNKLDPAVIKDGMDINYGQLKLAIKYASSQQLLLVKVFAGRYFSAKSVRGHIFSAFVKVELISTSSGEAENSLDLNENAPKFTNTVGQDRKFVFNEIFSFRVPEENFQDVKLRCSVWSSDGFESNEFLGEVYFDILELDCIDSSQTAWHDLRAQTDMAIGGDIDLHIGYKLPQTLTVTINSAHGIKKTSEDGKSALSVRASIPGVPHVFRTTPVRGEKEFTWIETFSFPIPKAELIGRYLVLVVADAYEDGSYLGECHINFEHLDATRGYGGTFQLSDMRGSSVVRSRWSRNAVTQELQEALYAHSMYKRPHFLFDPASPKTKALSVNVPKAFVHSQMRVANGVVVQ